MKKLVRLFLVCLFIAALFAGCSSGTAHEDRTLLAKPAASGQQQLLLKAVTEYLGDSVVLKYPMCSEGSSPFLWWDVDSDGTDELIVLYQNTAKSKNVQLAVMKQGSNGWYAVHMDVEGAAGEVDELRILRLADGEECLMAGYQDSTGQDWTVCLYRWRNGALQECERRFCQQYACIWLEDSWRLVMVQKNESYGNLQLRTFGAVPKELIDGQNVLDEPLITVLDPRFERCISLEVASIPETEPLIVMDFTDDSGNCLAEAMLWKNERFMRCYTADSSSIPNFTTRPFAGLSPADMDGDGVIEVPRVEAPVFSGGAGARFYLVSWHKVSLTETKQTAYSLVDVRAGYCLLLPMEWRELQLQMHAAPEGSWLLRSIETGELLLALRLTEAAEAEGFRPMGRLDTQRLYLKTGDGLSEQEKDILSNGLRIMYR
ncbi:MAG: hypothetical protein IJ412_04265 [Oscillospiraceae bacterium]|nr:hypothetical protein [Oscillospiraceae bacterium]